MASILRQIVAGPRAPHPEANLDLCYVTDKIIATSGPGATYPQVAYRNPLKDLVKFLDSKHGDQWAIWEFRAEGTGYPDSEVYGRVRHYPWPDHHPPPFALIPLIMASMRNWLKEKDAPEKRVVVVHCKAGKGRSGTVACSYLISEEGWTPKDATQRFTERRMRPGFGVGISIPSQQRWITYVDRWTRHGKLYVERPVEVLELHVWGLRDGVKISVEGFVDEGKVIKKFHTFQKSERERVSGSKPPRAGFSDAAWELMGQGRSERSRTTTSTGIIDEKQDGDGEDASTLDSDVIFRPSSKILLPSSDVNIDFERRNKTKYGGFTMVTAVAHVWFNTFFEGHGPENGGTADDSGVFEIEWDAMDGLKGSSRKGTRAFDKIAVVWKAMQSSRRPSITINEPAEGEEVQQTSPADWRGTEGIPTKLTKKLGLREEDVESEAVSRASSMTSEKGDGGETGHDSEDEMIGVKSDLQQTVSAPGRTTDEAGGGASEDKSAADVIPTTLAEGRPDILSSTQHLSTSNLPDVASADELKDARQHALGSVGRKTGT